MISGNFTRQTSSTCSIDWRIPDFFLIAERVDNCIQSPSFSFLNRIWFLQVFPKGEEENEYEQVIVNMATEGTLPSPIPVSYELGIKKKDGSQCLSMAGEFIFESATEMWGRQLCKLTTLYKYKNKRILQNTVTFFCVLCVKNAEDGGNTFQTPLLENTNCAQVSERSEIQQKKEKTEQEAGVAKLLQDMENLFHSGEESDVTMITGEQEFRVHKVILVARSAIFSSMFRHDTEEKKNSIVQISDFDPNTFRQFLIYLYTGNAETLSQNNIFDLYRIADKYDTTELKTACLKFMKDNLSVESICDTVALALLHEEPALLEKATEFFAKNVKKIILTVKWQIFLREYPVESNELLIKGMNYLIPE